MVFRLLNVITSAGGFLVCCYKVGDAVMVSSVEKAKSYAVVFLLWRTFFKELSNH